METEHSSEYRTVAAFGSVADAELVRGVLEADGIAVAVLDATDAALLPGAGRAVRVLVPAQDLSRARELLASPVLTADDEGAPPAAAPVWTWSLRWILLLAVLALAVLLFAL